MTNRSSCQRRCFWCEQEKQWHPRKMRARFGHSNPHMFSQEHVLLDCLGSFRNDLTLGDSVCAACNQMFGDTMDLLYGRSGIEGYARLKMGHKPANELHEFDRSSIKMSIVDAADPVWHGSRLRLQTHESIVSEVVDEAVVFLTPGGKKLSFNDEELEKLTSITSLDVPIGSELHFFGANEDVNKRRMDKIRSIGGQFLTPKTIPVPAKTGRIEGLMTQDRQRAITKMAISYLAKVCEDRFEHILYTDELKAIKSYVISGQSPGFNPVTPADPFAAIDIKTGEILGNGHIMGVTFNQDGARLQIVCPVYIYQLLPLSVYLTIDYKGVLVPISSLHHWSVDEPQVCQQALLQPKSPTEILTLEQIPIPEN